MNENVDVLNVNLSATDVDDRGNFAVAVAVAVLSPVMIETETRCYRYPHSILVVACGLRLV